MPQPTLLETVNKKCKPISQEIILLKAQVDLYLSQIENIPTDIGVDDKVSHIKEMVEETESLLKEIKLKDSSINKIYSEKDLASHDPQFLNAELSSQIQYQSTTKLKITQIKSKIKNSAPQITTNTCNHLGDSIIKSLDCGFFEGNETDKFAYKTFITKFKNSLDLQGNLNDALKLHCLKNKLKGYAYSIIQNLSSKENNYSKALEILDKEFLDEKHIKDEIYKKIIALRPNFDPSYNATRVYLNEIKSLIYELESYNIKFLEETAGLDLLSHIVLSKLPNTVVKEITRKLDTNYPDLN